MSETGIGESVWTGRGGREYRFFVHPLPCEAVGPAVRGVAVFAKKSGTAWRPIFIGHGDLQDLIGERERAPCIRAKGATHVHVRIVRAPIGALRTIALDLLEGNGAARAPKGCNDRLDD